jgi:acylphosphatase
MIGLWRLVGRVQGVGFRATTARIAKRFSIEGYVRNLPDGSVEIAVQGAENEVDRFLGAIQMELGAYIRETLVEDASVVRALGPGFVVRY